MCSMRPPNVGKVSQQVSIQKSCSGAESIDLADNNVDAFCVDSGKRNDSGQLQIGANVFPPELDVEGEKSGHVTLERPTKSLEKQFVVNIADAGHTRTIMCMVAESKGWRIETVRSKRSHVYAVVSEEDIERRFAELQPKQIMSRMPGLRQMCDKVAFAGLMHRMELTDPQRFNFFPRTYRLPDDNVPLSVWNQGPLIYKPDTGAGGDGIYLLCSADDLRRRQYLNPVDGAVLQSYIAHPLLLKGYKWDLRVYAFILSMNPLRVFMCREGLARVCCEPYVEATPRTLHRIGCHLTNYTISKYAAEYDHIDDPMDGTRGTKRSLSSTLNFLASLGHDAEFLKSQIFSIVAATTEAMASECGSSGQLYQQCFHILGLDIMFDHDCKAWLLEVNSSPSLSVDSVFPSTGKNAKSPEDPPKDAPHADLVRSAKVHMGNKAKNLCKCMKHHRPHWHAPCAVDLVAKVALLDGALEVVKRNLRSGGELCCTDLAEGTALDVVHDVPAVASESRCRKIPSTSDSFFAEWPTFKK